jgi:AcrR family transcriptional regulator
MSAATKEKLMRASLRLFVQKGIAATTTRDIAAAAGIAEGTIYRHFESKEAMADEIFLSHYLPFAGALKKVAGGSNDPLEQLRAMVRHFHRSFDADPEVFAFLLLGHHSTIGRIPDGTSTPISVLAETVERLAPKGRDAQLLTHLVLGMILQPATALLAGALVPPLSRHTDAVVEAIHGVLKR